MEFSSTKFANFQIALMTVQKFWFDVNWASLLVLTHEKFFFFFLLLDFKERFVNMIKKLLVHKMLMFTRSTVILITIHADVFWLAQYLLLFTWITIRFNHNSFSFGSFANKFFKSVDLIWELGERSAFETFDRRVDFFHPSCDFSTWVHVFKTCETYFMKAGQSDQISLLT